MTRFAFDDVDTSKSTPRKAQSSNFTASKHATTTGFRSSLLAKSTTKLAPGSSPGRTPIPSAKRPGGTAFQASTVGRRDLFGTTTPKPSRAFAPNIPTSAMKSPAGVRKMVPQKTSGGMSSTSSTDLFKMRIPSPPPELTGEKLAKEVPQDANRKGSVHADEYLSHLCPPDFDEDQRRQFFCVLDLRRLKYAANEIFNRKDWKLNIMNFAKEYEKSRGLIMLRYGLYEFKNVKPSEEVLKRWRAAHGLPEPEEPAPSAVGLKTNGTETGSVKGVTTSTKRKAEDALGTKDNTLTMSSTNVNKRRAMDNEKDETLVPAGTFNKNKRKAGEGAEVDENQPSKLHKSTSAPKPKSSFASIIDKVQSGTAASPSKSFGTSAQATPFSNRKGSDDIPQGAKGSSLFAPSTKDGLLKPKSSLFGEQPAGGSAGGSVLAAHKIGSNPSLGSNNIFGHLSESSAQNSADEDSDSASDEETDSQDVAPSAPASGGTNTPPVQAASSLFSTSKPSASTNVFGSAATSGTSTPKGGLFDRVTRGSDGQPLRASHTEDKENAAEKPKEPENYTWSPDKPISFGQSTTALFAPKPTVSTSAASPSPFAPKSSEQRTEASTSPQPKLLEAAPSAQSEEDKSTEPQEGAKEPTQPQSLFGKPSESSETPKASSIFSAPKSAPTPQPASIFSASKPSANSATSLFGAPPTSTEPKAGDSEKPKEIGPPSAAPSQANNLFGSVGKPAEQKPAESKTPFQSSTLFGGANKPEESAPNTASKTTSVFGNNTSTTAGSIFGSSAASTANAFGGNKPEDEAPPAKKRPIFGASNNGPASSSFTFGARSSASPAGDESKEPKPAQSKPLFGSTTPAATSFTFGSAATKANEPKPAATPADASNDSQSAKPKPKPIFGSSTPASNTPFSFGSTAAKPDQPKPAPNLFGGVGSGSASPFNFGQSSATPAKKPEESVGSRPNLFGSTTPAGPPAGSSSLFAFGQNTPAATEPQPTTTPATQAPSFAFGAQPTNPTPAAQPNATPAQNNMFSFNASQTGPAASSSGPATGPGGRKIAKPGGRFKKLTGSTPGSPVPSMFNQSQAPASNNEATNGGSSSFTFGQSQAPAVNTAGPASFTFGQSSSAANGQSAPTNPFGSSQAPAAPSNNLFGGAPSNATPSSSFNFSLGQQGPSTPQPGPAENKPLFGATTNGNPTAPTFNFTQATPTKNDNNTGGSLFASKPTSAAPSLFSGLAPTGSGTTSPFPAPSSLNTTPVNGGTPEPQAQGEKKQDGADGDDDEKPEEQISLTQGGPGEEDETIVHEVRAKALKYNEIDKNDPEAKKTPFTTMGVGPMRLLKNKTTGHVRLLLRAEPSGKVALNVSLIPGIDYKQNAKTVIFWAASASSDGKLDRWVLQVKTEDSAEALAALLEENKIANK